jgi:hypothetical protein
MAFWNAVLTNVTAKTPNIKSLYWGWMLLRFVATLRFVGKRLWQMIHVGVAIMSTP